MLLMDAPNRIPGSDNISFHLDIEVCMEEGWNRKQDNSFVTFAIVKDEAILTQFLKTQATDTRSILAIWSQVMTAIPTMNSQRFTFMFSRGFRSMIACPIVS